MWVSGCEKETRKREDEEEKEETSGRRRNGGSRRRRSRGYTWNVLACVYSQHAKLVGKVHLHCMESSLLMCNCLGPSIPALEDRAFTRDRSRRTRSMSSRNTRKRAGWKQADDEKLTGEDRRGEKNRGQHMRRGHVCLFRLNGVSTVRAF